MADPMTALGIGMKAVGWVASPIISELFKKSSAYLSFNASQKLLQLAPKVLLLERAMEVFDKIPNRPRLEQLFRDLKSAFYEAEDILDDVEYQYLKKKIQDDKFKSDGIEPLHKTGWVKKLLPKAPLLKNKETGMPKKELKDSLEKIEDIINSAYKFVEHLNLSTVSTFNGSHAGPANSGGAVTTAAPPPVVIGRDKDCDKIIEMLHEKEGEGQPDANNGVCYSVVGIHGIGGSGKSTLAQLVCAREKKDKQEKMEGHFDLIMWVHVSQSFSVSAIFKEIFEAATGSPCPQLTSLNVLQDKLEEELHGRRFLLVLDDVWYDIQDERQQGNLQLILSPLKAGQAGSKILVTSRTEEALLVLGAAKPRCIPISDLDDNAFLNLLMHYALEGAMIDDHDRRRLEAIGVDIAKKLKWSPLAARIVGGRLGRRLSAEFWTTVKNGNVDGTMGALWWSYLQLDQQARRCFAYCSIFPRRHHLIRDDLVKLWVAEGFVRGTNEGEETEDVCRGYFDELVSTSFLQPGGKDFCTDMDYYLVHDMLHDLADTVAGSDCFRIENGSIWSKVGGGKGQRREGWRGDVPRDVRHLFVQNYDSELITEKILQLKNLRTLIIYTVGGGTPIEEKVIASILKRLRKLRVLAIALNREDDAVIKEPDVFLVPESISKLKHLRYLAFRTSMSCRVILPGTVTKLYHMQLVDFGLCKKLVFPSADLINLRHIFCSIDLDFPNIGKLTSLQTVPNFTVWNAEGYKVNQLRDLNKLRGSLEICRLENVETKVEALEANLAAKERLTHLSLGWGVAMRSSRPEVEAGAFGSLCPPTWLETLYMYNYQGLRYLNKLRGSLEILHLDNVESKVEALEANQAAKERLTHLSLSQSGATRSSSPEVEAEVFESLCPPIWLETLYIYNYRGLRYPNWMVGKQNGGPKDLRGLKLHGWSQLGPAPRLEAFVHLRSLTVWDCSWDALPDNMENLILLKDLMICECLNISSLPTLPQALEEFTLKWCTDELMKSCQTIGHPNWQKIENVPKKEFICPEGYELDLLRIRNKRASLGTDIRRR